jgi:probable RNA-binding protein EIF1AD
MSGVGRKSQYRKHLTDSVLHDFPEPSPEQGTYLAKVVATRGGNQFDILLARAVTTIPTASEPVAETAEEASAIETNEILRLPQLALLPTKFRKLVWVKRNDYVLVESGDADARSSAGGGARYMIKHVLYKEQLKHLVQGGFWPLDDPEFPLVSKTDSYIDEVYIPIDNLQRTSSEVEHGGDSEPCSSADEPDDYLVNTNRRKHPSRRRSESSSSNDS